MTEKENTSKVVSLQELSKNPEKRILQRGKKDKDAAIECFVEAMKDTKGLTFGLARASFSAEKLDTITAPFHPENIYEFGDILHYILGNIFNISDALDEFRENEVLPCLKDEGYTDEEESVEFETHTGFRSKGVLLDSAGLNLKLRSSKDTCFDVTRSFVMMVDSLNYIAHSELLADYFGPEETQLVLRDRIIFRENMEDEDFPKEVNYKFYLNDKLSENNIDPTDSDVLRELINREKEFISAVVFKYNPEEKRFDMKTFGDPYLCYMDIKAIIVAIQLLRNPILVP